MEFSQQERDEIDKILNEVEKEQKQNGNKLYSFEEIVKKFVKESEWEDTNYKLRDIFF